MTHLRRLVPYLRAERRRLALGSLALVITTAFSVASPWVLRLAIDDLTTELTRAKLWQYAALLVGLVLVEGLFRYAMRSILIGLSRELEYALRGDLFAHLLKLAPGYYREKRVGDIMNRASSDLSAVRMVLGPGIMYTANTVCTAAFSIALMSSISAPLLGLALVPLVLVSYLVRRFGREVHDRFEAVQAQLSELSALVQENLAGARVVRAYVQEPFERERFEAQSQALYDKNRRLVRVYGALYPGIQLLIGLGSVLVIFLGGRLVIEGQISLGQFVAFSAYLAMLHWPMIALGWVLNIFERGEASMGRLLELLDAPVEIADGPLAPELQGALRVSELTFRYPGAQRPALSGVSFEAPAGSSLAIVGPTGSGKSTLLHLIARLDDPPPGTVFVDGHDVRTLRLDTLRGALGFVPQEAFLFSDSLERNVAFGLPPDAEAERVRAAARLAQLDKDVRDFPEGYLTRVGERGLTLSGGQKQRTALSRALARDPKILVLDDALAAVDTETEEQILSGLKRSGRARTTLIVSHRVSSVQHADQILVLEGGRLVERGSHQALVAQGGFYAHLARRQLLERELETAP